VVEGRIYIVLSAVKISERGDEFGSARIPASYDGRREKRVVVRAIKGKPRWALD
jgi:hypothetical protein